MVDDKGMRANKVAVLRDAAEGFRRLAGAGTDVSANLLYADLLERRAARIAAGDDDSSGFPADTFGHSSATAEDA
ncbi:hypothetical protein [Microbacterium oxydans]|uniref:Uncharacterized protein n=1 Tax=Microbacterium oxydans TaxID=82380 RepID=A0A0F0LBP5_9MICO|nr:hypothetical protein [Microbacterium oxydans]KJL30627.1 hypothetical protein RS83_00696 [Microbacterium oxydans]